MKKRNFKIFSLIITILMILSASSTVLADDGIINELVSVPPSSGNSLIVPFGGTPPLTSYVWNVATSGQYNFDGSSVYGNPLYTNYHFVGKTTYSFMVNNTSSNDVTVKIISSETGKSLYTMTAPKNCAAFFDFSTTGMFYLEFHSPAFLSNGNPFDVKGYVR